MVSFDLNLDVLENADTEPEKADLKERMAVREQIESNVDTINVIVTTYGMARSKDDNKFLRHLQPVVSAWLFHGKEICTKR